MASGTEPAALGVGPQEEVDAGVAEVRFVLLDGLDVADDLARVLDDERLLLGAGLDEVGHDALEVEGAPPAGHTWLGQDRGQRRGVLDRRRAQGDVAAAQFHGASVASGLGRGRLMLDFDRRR